MKPIQAILMVSQALLLSVSVMAEPARYTADKWHTRIYFTIDHMGLSNFSGRFLEHDIDFMFDEEDFSKSSVEGDRVPYYSD